MTDTVTWAPGAWPVHRHEDVDAMLVRVGRAEARRQRRQDHRNGRTAGAFLIAIWASAVVSSIFLEGVPTAAYLLPLLGFCTGLACLAIPWERISPSWLHVALATATVEIAIWVALADASYGVFYVLLAAYAGYVSRRRREVAALVALMFLALVAPLLYESDRVAVTGHAVLIMSVVAAVSVMAAWARGQVRARQRLYRQFALEALQLAIRIRGDALPPQPLEVGADAPAAHAGSAAQNGPGTEASERLTAELDPTAAPSAAIAAGSSRARLGVGRAALTTGTAALGLAVAVAGLASAGVTMPRPVRAPFDALSIRLPNQRPTAAARRDPVPPRSVSGGDRSPNRSPSSTRRHASTGGQVDPGPPEPGEPSTPADQLAPDGPAAPEQAKTGSPRGVATTIGGASTRPPRSASRSLRDPRAALSGLLPGGDAGGAPAVGATPGVGIKRPPRVEKRPSPPRR